MGLLAFTAPILPGKTEEWRRFAHELQGPRNKEFMESRRRLGVWERAFLQSTPEGDFVVVTREGDDPAGALRKFAGTKDPFTRWFAQQVKEIHGFDLAELAARPFPTLGVDSGQTAGAPAHRGKEDENRTVVRRFLEEVISAGKGGSWSELAAPSYHNYGFGAPMDRKGAEQLVKQFHAAFPDFRISIEDTIAEGDKVVCRFTIHGTHRGEFQGIAPTGKQISVPGIAAFRVENGKIVEDRPAFDQMIVLQQLGVMPVQQRRAA